jgi:hypothetical protein
VKEVYGPHGVPDLNTGGRIAPAIPVEEAIMISAMMMPPDLPPLDGLDQKDHKAQLGKLAGMSLVVMLLILRMATKIQDGWTGALGRSRYVKVSSNVKLRQALEVELLNPVSMAL